MVSVAEGVVVTKSSAPDWAEAYWLWKGAAKAPWLPSVAIKAETKTFTSFNPPGNVNAPVPAQWVTNALILRGQTIADGSPGADHPGLTFTWSPFALGALAFVTPRRQLMVIDSEGRTLEVPGASDVLLPGWSEDGTQIAYLSPQGNAYVLRVVSVSF